MNDEPKTERDKYIEGIEAKLAKAGKAKRFLGSEDGALVTDWLTQQVNTLVKNIGGKKYINDHSSYVFDTGQLTMAQRILTMLNAEASTDTDTLTENLKAAKSDDATASS